MAEQPPQQPVVDYARPSTPAARGWMARLTGSGLLGWVLFIGLAIMLFLLLNQRSQTFAAMSLSDLVAEFKAGRVTEVTVESDALYGTIPDNPTPRFRVELAGGMGSDWAFINWLLENSNGAEVVLSSNSNLMVNLLVPLIPWLLIFGFVWFFVFRHVRRSAAVNPAAPAPIPVYIVQPETR